MTHHDFSSHGLTRDVHGKFKMPQLQIAKLSKNDPNRPAKLTSRFDCRCGQGLPSMGDKKRRAGSTILVPWKAARGHRDLRPAGESEVTRNHEYIPFYKRCQRGYRSPDPKKNWALSEPPQNRGSCRCDQRRNYRTRQPKRIGAGPSRNRPRWLNGFGLSRPAGLV